MVKCQQEHVATQEHVAQEPGCLQVANNKRTLAIRGETHVKASLHVVSFGHVVLSPLRYNVGNKLRKAKKQRRRFMR